MNKILYSGIALMSVGVVGIMVAIVMEMVTGEPIYLVIMKATACLFGVGGPLLGLAIAKKGRDKHE